METQTPLASDALAVSDFEQFSCLLQFNDHVLAQAEALAEAHLGPEAPPFASLVGPHLRHIVEHFQALLDVSGEGVVDYDARQRDRMLETSAAIALKRISELRSNLRCFTFDQMHELLYVQTLCGLRGEWPVRTVSTRMRELIFLASHAIHHFAVLRDHCEKHGVEVPVHFGKAPATVSNEIRLTSMTH